jgi:hypothetical protein
LKRTGRVQSSFGGSGVGFVEEGKKLRKLFFVDIILRVPTSFFSD